MSDLVDELRAIQSPEECRRLMLWAASVIETGRKRFVEKVERIDKLEAENATLRASLPLIDNRTRNEAINLLDKAVQISECKESWMVPLHAARDVVTNLLADNANLREELARVAKELLKYEGKAIVVEITSERR